MTACPMVVVAYAFDCKLIRKKDKLAGLAGSKFLKNLHHSLRDMFSYRDGSGSWNGWVYLLNTLTTKNIFFTLYRAWTPGCALDTTMC